MEINLGVMRLVLKFGDQPEMVDMAVGDDNPLDIR